MRGHRTSRIGTGEGEEGNKAKSKKGYFFWKVEGNELKKKKKSKETEKKKKKKREGDRGPYLGSLTSGAPDLEGKNRKKGRKGKKEGHKKDTG